MTCWRVLANAGYADNYSLKAFGTLLGDVAKFAQAHGPKRG